MRSSLPSPIPATRTITPRRPWAATTGVADAAVAITVHVGAMLAVMAVVSLVVYEKLGLTFLR